jgi:hypothetical protein
MRFDDPQIIQRVTTHVLGRPDDMSLNGIAPIFLDPNLSLSPG